MSDTDCKCLSEKEKWAVCIYTGLLFLLVASPWLYKLTGQLTSGMGWETSDMSGCPNMAGLVLHTVVFILLVRLLMAVPLPGKKKSKSS